MTRVPINALAPFSQQDQMSRIDLCSTAQTANLLLTNKKTQMKSLAISSLELAGNQSQCLSYIASRPLYQIAHLSFIKLIYL